METQIKEKTDINLVKVENYLQTASKHLFVTENKRFFKVFPIQKNGRSYYVTMEFDGKASNYVRIGSVERHIQSYGNDSKCVLSNEIFPPHYDKRSSIVNFKAMREKTEEVKSFIEENFDGENTTHIEKEAAKLLVGLELKEQGE